MISICVLVLIGAIFIIMLTIQLNKFSKTSIFIQIKEQIQHIIMSQKLPDLTLLPTEKEFSTYYDISMGSIKRAYDELEADGWVKRIKGKGTFVQNRPIFKVGFDELKGSQLIQKYKETLQTHELLFQESWMDSNSFPFIKIDAKHTHFQLKTLYSIQDNPVFVEELFFNSKFYPNLQNHHPFKQNFLALSDYFPVHLVDQKLTFLTERFDDYHTQLLNLIAYSAITMVISTFETADHEIACVQVYYFPSDYTEFVRRIQNV